jgi:vacuolar-type H+-ATPase subunit E/Vma4
MSREVLINDLRAKGEQQIDTLWREARAEVERFRTEALERVTVERNSCDLTGREARQSLQRRRAMAARRRAGEIITRAEQELGDRLYGLARGLLGAAWSGDRATLLAGLAAELPPGSWGRVRVNPVDVVAVGPLFPAAEIVPDAKVLGGLEVSNRDGSVTIDNTLNTRLERSWSRLVPELLRGLR